MQTLLLPRQRLHPAPSRALRHQDCRPARRGQAGQGPAVQSRCSVACALRPIHKASAMRSDAVSAWHERHSCGAAVSGEQPRPQTQSLACECCFLGGATWPSSPATSGLTAAERFKGPTGVLSDALSGMNGFGHIRRLSNPIEAMMVEGPRLCGRRSNVSRTVHVMHARLVSWLSRVWRFDAIQTTAAAARQQRLGGSVRSVRDFE